MMVRSKAEMLKIFQEIDPNETKDLFAMGMLLVCAACAKEGETLLESVDLLHDCVEASEFALRHSWDSLRNFK